MEDEQRKYIQFKDLADVDNKGENRHELLKSELEAIAANLQPHYSGRLVVERCVPKEESIAYDDWQDIRNHICNERSKIMHPLLAIRELSEEKKLFGIAKKEKSRLVMAFDEVFTGEEDYIRQLDALVADARAEIELFAYSQKIAEDHGLTGISIERIQ
ncbi:MAG: hypothetical protein V1734_06340 [Nanoarchaeota archaeon]